MAEPTLQQIFGTNASQTSTDIILKKADFTDVNLTASATNRAEALFAAIMLKALLYLTPTNQESNVDIQITIEPSYESLVTRNSQTYRQKTYSFNFQRLDTGTALRADDF